MDIAALSMTLSQQQLMQNVSLAVTKQAVEIQQQSTNQLVEMVNAQHPNLGQTIDISV